jgi:hypothetical protein
MNNHKSVTISILHFLKHDKNVILYFLENMHKKPLGFDCLHENKIFFVFLNKVNFWIFFLILEKIRYFLYRVWIL